MSKLEDQHQRQLIEDWQNQPLEFMVPITPHSSFSIETPESFTSIHNPFGLNLVAEGTQIIIHVEEIKDTTKAGVFLTENAKKELAEAEALKDSKLYYIIGVSEEVARVGKYRAGQWVVLRPGVDAQSVRVDGKLHILTEAYNIAATVTFHEEQDIESQYHVQA